MTHPVATAADRDWRLRPERGNARITKLMVWISLHLGRPAGRFLLHGIAAYFLAAVPAARRASGDYLRRVLQRAPTLGERYRHFFYFAATIHDRIYLLNERFDLFRINIVGDDIIRRHIDAGNGVLLMGAHLGSFEVMHAMARHRTELRVSMVMYEENARQLGAILAAINPTASQDIVPLGHVDSMLQVRDRLDAGHLVGILSDRDLGSGPTSDYEFLGAPAPFPLGPFRMAAMLRRPVVFMTGLYLGDNRYELHFEQLADFSNVERTERNQAILHAQRNYADRLAHFCRLAPCNWFNFFDFWQSAKRH
ncbi:MAG: acyl-CoA synthetase [Georgfuchsia sp.]